MDIYPAVTKHGTSCNVTYFTLSFTERLARFDA